MSLVKYIGLAAAALIPAITPINASAQQATFKLETIVCSDLPIATIVKKTGEPLYTVEDMGFYGIGFSPVLVPWENARGSMSASEKNSCSPAKKGQKVNWKNGYIPTDEISIEGSAIYVVKGHYKKFLPLPIMESERKR